MHESGKGQTNQSSCSSRCKGKLPTCVIKQDLELVSEALKTHTELLFAFNSCPQADVESGLKFRAGAAKGGPLAESGPQPSL